MPPEIIRDIFTRIRSKFFGAVGQYNLVKPILVDHEGCILQLDVNGNLLTAPGGGGGVWGLYNEDTAAVDGDLGQAILAVRNDGANTVLTSANGDYSWISVDDRGQVFVRTDPSPAEPWQTLRVFAATPADAVLPTVLQAVGPGGVDLSVAVYPWNALIGLTVDVNGQTCTFLAGDVVSEAAILLALNTAITDVNWTVTVGPPDFLVGTKLSPGNIVLSGTAVVTLGLAAGTTGNWVSLPQSRGMIEIGFIPTLAVANDPTEVIYRIWRLSADVGGVAERAGEIRVPAAAVALQYSRRFSFDGSAVYLQLAFVGGTAPTLTGTVDVRVVYDGDTPVQVPTMHAVTASILADDGWDNAPTHDIYNYAVSRGDGAAVRATNSTIDFAGPALTSEQLRRVLVVVSGNNLPLVWEQGRNAKLTIAAGGPSGQIITVAAFDGTTAPIPATALLLDVMWSGNDKAIVLGLGGPVFAEDSAHTSGDLGVEMLAVRRDVAISSGGSDGDYVTLNEDADGYLYIRSKSYDSASNADRGFEVAPVWSRNVATPVTIGTAVAVGAAWADLGPEIPTQGYTQIVLWLNIDINDAQNLRIRLLNKHTSAHANEYTSVINSVDTSGPPFNVKFQPEYLEYDVDADGLVILPFEVFNSVPFVQFRIMAEVAGASPASILNAEVTYGYGG